MKAFLIDYIDLSFIQERIVIVGFLENVTDKILIHRFVIYPGKNSYSRFFRKRYR